MTAKKQRPGFRDPVTPGMSLRDQAAALGASKTEVARWIALSELSPAEFDRRLAAHNTATGWRRATAASMLREPVPAQGRVERALAIVRSMTVDEHRRFHAALNAPTPTRRKRVRTP